uniref:THAP domain-containing protein 1 n=1 Tax=Amphiprion percula TaxID=161767 RepID=A0A3P8T0G1_AMPPE
MVHTCVVSGCRNRRTPGTSLSFYRFPRDPDRKQRWINAVNREGWIPNDGSRLCSTHFISGLQRSRRSFLRSRRSLWRKVFPPQSALMKMKMMMNL